MGLTINHHKSALFMDLVTKITIVHGFNHHKSLCPMGFLVKFYSMGEETAPSVCEQRPTTGPSQGTGAARRLVAYDTGTFAQELRRRVSERVWSPREWLYQLILL
jgi:hypothetical protein